VFGDLRLRDERERDEMRKYGIEGDLKWGRRGRVEGDFWDCL